MGCWRQATPASNLRPPRRAELFLVLLPRGVLAVTILVATLRLAAALCLSLTPIDSSGRRSLAPLGALPRMLRLLYLRLL